MPVTKLCHDDLCQSWTVVVSCAQVQLFADTFTEQLSYMSMLRADSAEAFETAKQKFITGLTVSTICQHAHPVC